MPHPKRVNFDSFMAQKGLTGGGATFTGTAALNHKQLEELLRTADAGGMVVTFTGSQLTVSPS